MTNRGDGVRITIINRSVWSLMLLLLTAPAIASCTNSTTPPAAASTHATSANATATTTTGTSGAAGPTATPTGVAALALSAYAHMWAEYVHASNTGQYPDIALGHYAGGTAFTTLMKGLESNHSTGVLTKGAPSFTPTITQLYPSANPTQIVITDCLDDSNWLTYSKATGKPQDNTPGGLHKVQALVTETYGLWLVNQLAVQGVGTCTR